MDRQLSIAYCAGLLDADGSFAIHYKRPHTQRPNGSPYFIGKIQIKQVERGGIDLLRETFGGPELKIVPPSCSGGKPLYYWTIMASKAADACIAMIPYLRIKRRQAELLVELNKEICFSPYSKSGKTALSIMKGKEVTIQLRGIDPESLKRRYRLLNESRSLNDTRHPMIDVG
jgi:hypothetical protein